ncbi:MAG: hypothetical protein LBS97_01720 [Treponema sp.]|jgi:hypothetical protein|nr:hypothetical protein [Treponema sp.]
MGFFIARFSGSSLAAVLALIAFVLQLLIRKKKLPVLWIRIISGLGAAGALYVLGATIGNVLKYPIGVSSLITIFAPLSAYTLALAVHFALIFLAAKTPKTSRVTYTTLAAAVVVSIQLALGLFNLIRNWNNFTRGNSQFLSIQLVYLVVVVISVALFWINFIKTKTFTRAEKT